MSAPFPAASGTPRRSPIRALAFASTAVAIAVVLGTFALFALESWPAWRRAGLSFLTSPEWSYRDARFGAAAMIYGTLAVAGIALGIAAPLGIGAALCTSEILPARARLPVKIAIELLAGVPSVVYGLLGIAFLRGWVDRAAGGERYAGDSLLTAGILLAVMVLPTVMTLCDDALRAVPRAQRLQARSLGLSRVDGILFVAVPQAWRGWVAALLLGLGRALGETIAVFLVVGRQDGVLPSSWTALGPLLEPLTRPGQTLASKLGGSEVGIAWGDPLHFGALLGLGVVLLALVLGATSIGARLGGRTVQRG